MSTYSLLGVHRTEGDTVEGGWIQDHIGTLESARRKADQTSAANGGMPVAVVEKVGHGGPGDVFRARRLA